VTAALTGNAATATALQTARTIGGVSFDGTANIDLPGVNQEGNQNTTGNAAGLEGLTASIVELNYADGLTSSVQGQLDAKAPLSSPVFTGTSVKISTTSPNLRMVDTDGNSGYNQTRVTQNANSLTVASYNSAETLVGLDYEIDKSASGAETHKFYTNNNERVRIAATGAVGFGGENFGSSGQVLTSGGIAGTPAWTSPRYPNAFGTVSAAGVVTAAFNVASASWYEAGKCRVTFTTSLGTSAYVALPTLFNSSAGLPLIVWAYPSITAGGSFVDVYVKNTSGTFTTAAFSFVCFRP
jgi:hypothetical protein